MPIQIEHVTLRNFRKFKAFRTNQEIAEFIDAMRGEGIKCHVFRRKEIENYVLSVDVIQRRC
jgi:hypothetical protein